MLGRAAILTLPLLLGGCVQAVGTARTHLAEIAGPPPAPFQPVCPGLEVDGRCESTSLQDIHPASSPVVRSQSSGKRCPPTVLGVPGWCTQF